MAGPSPRLSTNRNAGDTVSDPTGPRIEPKPCRLTTARMTGKRMSFFVHPRKQMETIQPCRLDETYNELKVYC